MTTAAAIIDNAQFNRKRYGWNDFGYEATISFKHCNSFIFRTGICLLERQGYSVIPARYKEDPRDGHLTEKVWLYRATRGNRTIWIHADSKKHRLP